MTQNYIGIAEAFKESKARAINHVEQIGMEKAAQEVATYLCKDNPNFKPERFLIACGFAPVERSVLV